MPSIGSRTHGDWLVSSDSTVHRVHRVQGFHSRYLQRTCRELHLELQLRAFGPVELAANSCAAATPCVIHRAAPVEPHDDRKPRGALVAHQSGSSPFSRRNFNMFAACTH